MEIIALVGCAIGAIGFLFALFCARRLHKWETYLKRSRIAIAYKGKVKLQAPLVEWCQWTDMLDKDERSRGRAVYKMGGTTVAILKPLPKEHGQSKVTTLAEKRALQGNASNR